MTAVLSKDDEEMPNSSATNSVAPDGKSCSDARVCALSQGLFISSQGELINPTTESTVHTDNKRPQSARDPFPSLMQTGAGLVQSLIQSAAGGAVVRATQQGRSEYGVAYYPLESSAPIHGDEYLCEENYRSQNFCGSSGSSSGGAGIVNRTNSSLIEYSVLPLDIDRAAGGDVTLSIDNNHSDDDYPNSRRPSGRPEQYAINNSLYRRRQADRVAHIRSVIQDQSLKRVRPNTPHTADEPELNEMLLLSELPLQATGAATGALKSDLGGSFKRVFSNNVDGTYLSTSGNGTGTDTAMSTDRPHLSRCGGDIAHGVPHFEFREEVVHGATADAAAGGRHYVPTITIPNPFAASTVQHGAGGGMYNSSAMLRQDTASGHNRKSNSRRRNGNRRRAAKRDSSEESSFRDADLNGLPTVEMRKYGGADRAAADQHGATRNSHRSGFRRKEEVALHRSPYYKSDTKEGGAAGGAVDDEVENAHGGEGALGFIGILRSQPILASMIFIIPVAFTAYWLNWGDVAVFSLNFVAIVPMAWLMGKATEDLSAHMGQITGGLLNAWFGNVVEMLLCIAGLRRGELVVVRSTLIGSILSNLLLVTGCSFLLGGMRHKVQEFSAIGASTNASLMTLSCMCLGLPTIYASILSSATKSELAISRAVSFFLIFIYIQYLVFQLVTHSFLFTEDDEEHADLSVWGAAILLLFCSIICSFCSDYLVASIEGVVTKFSLSKEFIGIILLPIVGNAAEHYTSVIVAMRNKMDLSLACAVGSSCQMALFVTPFTVLVGWMLNQPMTLDLHPFELLVLVMSVLIITSILQDGYSHWLEGSMLVSAYCVIAIIYFFEEPQYSEII